MTDSTSDSEEFSFSGVDISSMMNSFGDNFLTSINMRDQGSNIIFDTCVCYDEYSILLYKWLLVYIV